MKTYSFEKLEVWKEACLLAKEIYLLVNTFPDNEKYGLCSQLQRAAVSVSSNIAEGSSRTTLKEQARFTNIAFSSLMEVLSELIIAYQLNYISEDHYSKLRLIINKMSYKLNKLHIYQRK